MMGIGFFELIIVGVMAFIMIGGVVAVVVALSSSRGRDQDRP